MPRTIRFHLDENGSKAIAVGLRRHGIDVTTSPEAELKGAIDEDQAAYCQAEGRILFTQDHDFLRLDRMGPEHAGIAYCVKDTKSVVEIFGTLSSCGKSLTRATCWAGLNISDSRDFPLIFTKNDPRVGRFGLESQSRRRQG